MESTKEDSAIGTPASTTNLPLSNQDSRPSTSKTTKQAGTTLAGSQTRDIDQKQRPKSPISSSEGSKDSSDKNSPLLNEDPFASKQSKALFDAIDELRTCGAGQDLELPQVSHCALLFDFFQRTNKYIARNCGTAISRKVILASKFDRHPLHCRRRLMYSICYTNHISEDSAWNISNDSYFN